MVTIERCGYNVTMPSLPSPEALVRAYAELARPIVLAFTEPEAQHSDCIGATRVAYHTFQALGLKVEPLAVRWVVKVPALNFAFVVGLRGRELANAEQSSGGFKVRPAWGGGPGWDGHLVLIVEDRWFVDSVFDQCGAHPQLKIPPMVFVLDLKDSPIHPRDLEICGEVVTSQDVRMEVCYRPLDEDNAVWETSESWNEPAAKAIGSLVADAILDYCGTK